MNVMPEEFITKRFDGIPLKSPEELFVVSLESEGRKHWTKFHKEVHTAEQLLEWEKTIPMFGCDCEGDYQSFKKQCVLPVFVDGIVNFDWKNEVHNLVNKKLLKPQVSLEEAHKIWNANILIQQEIAS